MITSQKIGCRINKLIVSMQMCPSICRSERKWTFKSKFSLHQSLCKPLNFEDFCWIWLKMVSAIGALKHPSNHSKKHNTAINSSVCDHPFPVASTTPLGWHKVLQPLLLPSAPCATLRCDRLRTAPVSTAGRGSTHAVGPPQHTSDYCTEMKAKHLPGPGHWWRHFPVTGRAAE